jgi:hypothetical protein
MQEPAILQRPVAEVMGPPLQAVGSGEPVDLAVARLEEVPAVLVLDRGHPVAVLTRSDVLAFLAKSAGQREGASAGRRGDQPVGQQDDLHSRRREGRPGGERNPS